MTPTIPEAVRVRAEKLLLARQAAETGLDIAPVSDIREAYLCHKLIADGLGKPVAGWKVAHNPEFGATAAPMFAGDVVTGPATWPFRPGLNAEVELAVRLDRDFPSGPASAEALEKSEKQAFVGVELVQSRLSRSGQASFPTALSDCLANVGYVASAEVQPWPSFDINTRRCTVTLDGEVLFDALSTHTMGGPMMPLAGYARAGGDHLGGFKAGQLVTTGSICGVVPIPRKGRLVATIDGLGSVTIDFV